MLATTIQNQIALLYESPCKDTRYQESIIKSSRVFRPWTVPFGLGDQISDVEYGVYGQV